jgi:hypothetical protein
LQRQIRGAAHNDRTPDVLKIARTDPLGPSPARSICLPECSIAIVSAKEFL